MFLLGRVIKINMLGVSKMKLWKANRNRLFANSCTNNGSLKGSSEFRNNKPRHRVP